MPFEHLKTYILNQFEEKPVEDIFDFSNSFSAVLNRETSHIESLILLLTLVPHVHPGFYEAIIAHCYPEGGEHPEWGGVKEEQYRSMQPTGETIQFLLAGSNMENRLQLQEYFETDHWFYQTQLLFLSDVKEGMPFMSGKVVLPPESLQLLLFGESLSPRFGPDFPARELNTLLDWSDLVLRESTASQIEDIRLWIQHHKLLREDWGLEKRIAPGYKSLFYGPSGTGKTLTASLLGKEFGKPVYRIDLSQLVSKYIGETEKNLEKIFVRATQKDWILFFDEADAVFGKRTTTNSSQDRFANQTVSFLLQRVETFDGIVILASNYKNNIDEAFLRRFNTIIKFVKPNERERFVLWEKALPKPIKINKELLRKLAVNYELTGAQIVNAITNSCLQAAHKKTKTLTEPMVLKAIRAEFDKEERVFTDLR